MTADLSGYSTDDLAVMHEQVAQTAAAMMEDLATRPTWTDSYKKDRAGAMALMREAKSYSDEILRRYRARRALEDIADTSCDMIAKASGND